MMAMDEVTEHDSMPTMDSLDWSSLGPKMTKALVVAQSHIKTVPTDAYNAGMKFKYASQDAITREARAAMAAAEIAILMDGWVIDGDMIRARFIIIHCEGSTSPIINLCMPYVIRGDARTSLGACLTYMRKYLYAGILNMSWCDPREDTEADDVNGRNQSRQRDHAQQSRQVRRAPAPTDPVAEYRQSALKNATEWGKWLISKGVCKESLMNFVTGVDGPTPKPTPTSMLEAITIVGRSIAETGSESDGSLPVTDHSSMTSFLDHIQVSPLWRDGKRTVSGDSVDAKWPMRE